MSPGWHFKLQTLFALFKVGPLLAAHLQALAKNCPMLQHFRLIGFKVEDAASLKDVKEEFKHLRQLNISLYDCEDDSSDEEEEQEDAGVVGRASVEVASFFLESAFRLEVSMIDLKQD